jgi:AcrR family transcriptional regulator
MQEKKSKKAQQWEETRRALLVAARKLFGKSGFAATGTEELVAAAKVTRGALYYHFADKTALFDAVFEEIAVEVLAAIEAAAAARPTKLDGLIAGCRAYLEACLQPSVRRIYVIDAPSVLGPARVREVDARHAQGSLREGIEDVLAETRAMGLSADALTALFSGALDEAVLWLVRHDEPAARRRLEATLEALIRRTFKV